LAPLFALPCFVEHGKGIELENRIEKSFVTFVSFLLSKESPKMAPNQLVPPPADAPSATQPPRRPAASSCCVLPFIFPLLVVGTGCMNRELSLGKCKS
jgi:hypothetical protein